VLGIVLRELRKAVVLAEEDDGQPPKGCEVEGLVEGAGRDGAAAEKAHHHVTAVPTAKGVRSADGDRQPSTDAPDAGVGHVHGPPPTVAGASLFAYHLREQPARLHPLGRHVAATTAGGGDDIGAPSVHQGPYSACLRGRRGVHEPRDRAVRVEG